MDQGEEHGAHCCQPGPALVHQQGMQGVQALVAGQAAGGQVGHEHNGDDDLVGGKAQDKGGQNHAVHAQRLAQRVQEAGAVGQQAGAAHLHVGQHPDEQPRRGGDHHRPAQHEHRPVQHRADDHLPHPGAAVGGQLQGEGGGHALEHRGRQQPGDLEGEKHPQHDHTGKQQGGQQRPPRSAAGAHKKHGDDGDEGGKAAVAGHKVVGQHGDEPLPRGVDDTAAHHPGGVAAKAHGHGEGLFAAGSGLLEGVVQHKGHPRQVAEVLQQGEDGEKDGHGGQHHRHHPGQHPVDPQYQRPVEPLRGIPVCKQVGQPVLEPEEAVGQPNNGQGGGAAA